MPTQTSTCYQFSIRPCLNSNPRLFFRIDEFLNVWAENVFFNDDEEAIRYLKDRLYIEREVKHHDHEEIKHVLERIEVCMENGMWFAGNNEAVIELFPAIVAVI